MKDITIYTPAKYNTDKYTKVKDNIYKTYDNFMKQDSFVTSLSFEQEPEYGEGESSADISQYPLEDILDRYYVAIEDFYGEINDCVYEFSGSSIENIEKLLGIVGKHVYNKTVENDGEAYTVLEVE